MDGTVEAAGAARPSSRPQRKPPSLPVAMLVGGLVPVAVVAWAVAERNAVLSDAPAWIVLVLALGVCAGAVFVYGLRRQSAIDAVTSLDWRSCRRDAWRIVLAASAVVVVPLVLDFSAGTTRGAILTLLALLSTGPALAALQAMKPALARTNSQALPARLTAYLELRRITMHMLPAMGSLVALTTFALGASRLATPPGTEPLAPEVVLVYGAVGTLFVALAFAEPAQRLRVEARALVGELAPLRSGDPGALTQELEQRDKLERLLGVSGTLLGDLQAGLTIFGPLLSAAVALLLPT